MSLLTIVQDAMMECSLSQPSELFNSADEQVLQFLALAQREGKTLRRRGQWSQLVNEASWTTLAAVDQGLMTTIAGAGFDYIINETIWDRSLRRPLFGPKAPTDWQQLIAQSFSGPWSQWRIRGGHLYATPAPSAGNTWTFEWVSKNWCQNAAGSSTYARWMADTDTGLLDEDLMTLGIIWRWKSSKGLEYVEDFNAYERQVADAMARDGGKPRLSLEGAVRDIEPGVLVPTGNWSL